MEFAGINSASNAKHPQTLPPRRGQIKMRILKNAIKSATAFASAAGAGFFRRTIAEDGAPLGSPSSSPAIPSGYNSDA